MARKQLPSGRNRNPNNDSTSPATTKNSPKTIGNSSNGSRNRITEAANGDASSEDTEVSVVPSSSVESENDEATDSSEAEDDGVEQRSSSNEEEEEEVEEEEEEGEGEGEGEEEEEEEQEQEQEDEDEETKPNSVNRKGKRDNAKSKGKKRSRKEEDESEAEEKGENAQYVFPMKRINRIAKVENPDRKFFQEAVFVINKASEKFLQVFCKEAYACAFLEKKKQIAYNHLSSVVSKRKRFQFISDFVPEKTKAKDALALGEEAEMTKAKEK
ncbi:cilia- and flagella-associated protein 251-like [Salvia hispanica]|uniref:cilia- and flagella-associated protein 251-like n=1 Tax=Salvia hispanica TaxID=49212 RepID=UPI0020092B48|nr:cilia- and flagella-associated protein 251-like [Salvia hispanica]